MGEFPPHTYAEWREAAEALLKGRDFEKALRTRTAEGIVLEPLYMEEVVKRSVTGVPGLGSRVRGSRVSGYLEKGWLVSQELSAPTPEELNAVALEALQGGQNELNIWLDLPGRRGLDAEQKDRSVGVCGVSVSTVGDVKRLLQGIHMQMISLYWHAGVAAPALLALLATALRERGQELGVVQGCLGFDPVGWKVESGSYPGSEEAVAALMVDLFEVTEREMPHLQVFDVQGHGYHDAGGSSVQEMAAVLATAVYYLKTLQAAGIEPARVAARMRLSVSIGGQTFLEIAKLRAMRLLWSRVLEAFGVEDACPMHLHARTGLWNKTVLDPYVNLLRTTTEAFSAVIGGCDSLHVAPFDEVIRESDPFSRRIARNTHSILLEECDLGRVIDPAGGSWAVESLTDQMARLAWKQFQEIEGAGGIVRVLESGRLQEQIEEVRRARELALEERKDVLVGTNSYAQVNETFLKRAAVDYEVVRRERESALEMWKTLREASDVEAALASVRAAAPGQQMSGLMAAAAAGATLGELTAALSLGADAKASQPLRVRRGGEPFEQLRLTAESMRAAGRAPSILQINMGPSRGYRLRADWTSGFFQAGGLSVLNETDFPGIDAALESLRSSGARAAILTSSDATYGESAVEWATAIKAACPQVRLYLAGAPGEQEAAWRAAGIDDFVHVRVNAYRFNRDLLVYLGAPL
jgi:methylmalonyl-CoA mutase